ncbi:MAG: DUF4382 domain-containing protein [Cyanobacteria bacterium P01_F01_bin.153]
MAGSIVGQLAERAFRWRPLAIASLLATALSSCGGSAAEMSKLGLVVNGETFAQEGMVSKDNWQISFQEIAVTVGSVTASGVPSPDEGSDEVLEASWPLKEGDAAQEFVTVTLHEGPAQLGAQEVPVGNYNQVKWKWGGSEAAIAMKGTAVKGDQTIEFDMALPGAFQVVCGDYVGDKRKGIVTADSEGEVELTLHLDHLFGDGESPPSAEINTKSLGFAPFAATAEGGKVALATADADTWATPQLRQLLQEVLMSMPHVGEGHCEVETLESS